MVKRLATLAAVVVGISVGAHAASLDLPRQATPDIWSNATTTTYVLEGDGTGTLTAIGRPRKLSAPPDQIIFSNMDDFALSVRVDSATGALVEPGTLTITGAVPDRGITDVNTTLLTGEVTRMGFPDPPPPGELAVNDPLEFVFTVTGGALEDLYGGVGSLGGVTLWVQGSGSSGFDATKGFTENFSSDMFRGESDTYVIPEPITAVAAIPIVLLAGIVRRRRSLAVH